MSESRSLANFSLLAARLIPLPLKKWINRSRILDRIAHRTLARMATIGGSTVVIRSGPLAGLRLEMNEHVMSSHVMGTYEHMTQLAIDRFVLPDSICYDLGASIGYFSLLMARKAKHVYAFEPAPHAAEQLRKQAAINQLQNITIVPNPASDSEREVTFSLTDVAYGSCIVESETKWPTLALKTTTLDGFAKAHPAPDFIKIDVEGEEAKVLLGARSILAEKKPIICCEIHSARLAEEVQQFLATCGYRLTTLDDQPFHPGGRVVAGEVQILAFPK